MNFNLTPENMMIKKAAAEFNERTIEPIAAQMDQECKAPPEILKKLARAGLLGFTIPRKYGGSEAGHINLVLAIEELGCSGSVIAFFVSINNSVGENMYRFGSENIREKYLRPLCEGDAYASVVFTEPSTGSDPKAILTTAIPEKDYYVLNGAKRFITGGARKGYAVVYAKDETGQLSAFVVDKESHGYTASEPWQMMGLGGQGVVDVYLKNVKVPKENLLGKKGEGFRVLQSWSAGNKLEQCGWLLGIGQSAINESVKYAKERVVRKKPLGSMQSAQWLLSEMQARVEAARWLTYRTAFLYEQGASITEQAATLKLFVAPAIQQTVGMGLQIHGSYGYCKGFKIERLYRAAASVGVMGSSIEVQRSITAHSLMG